MTASASPSFETILYDVDGPIATITLNRPQQANAQSMALIDELDAAFDLADADDDVRVVILAANGKHFSSGHDLKELVGPDASPELGERRATPEGRLRHEQKMYFDKCVRIYEFRKPTIAAVQGKCIAGALNLIWPMDLIIAAENATFSDPVVALGACGVEYHGHTWEFGARKAKEMLFTGRSMTAHEAEQIGMVNRVVPLDELWPNAMALAHEISQFHPFALRQAKRAVNQTLDVMGQHAALQSAFDIHHTTHGNAISVTGYPVMASLDDMKGRIKDQ